MRCSYPARWLLVLVGVLLAGPSLAADTDTTASDEQVLQEAKVGTDGPALLDFFRKRTVDDTSLERIGALIRQLGDDSFDVRQKASADLTALGPIAVPQLQQALKDSDIEIVRRAEECIHQIEEGNSPLMVPAAVRLLARRHPAGAAETLLAYLPFAANDSLVEDIHRALGTLAVQDGKPDPVLVKALEDRLPARRAAAGVALTRAELADQRPAVRKLLQDPDPVVRLRVGLALARARDREAIPVLIALLGDLPANRLGEVEDVLYRLAGDSAPTVSPGSDTASRDRYRTAWADWWHKQGDKVNLARLDAEPMLGYTMVILLDAGRLQEMDRDNKIRWQIDNLQFPLDAQMLPGDRVLVTENQANRITERNLKGEVLWQQPVDGPLMAQRLPNGNTFIATRTQLLEVDRNNREVWSYSRPGGDAFMRAQKLRNGDIAVVTATSQYVRLDPTTKKELQSFPVDIRTFGGRIEVLPNGRVLVPQFTTGKVVEQDGEGKVVWEAPFEQPIVAVRLPNGNTLVTSLTQQRAVEMDPTGKTVWEFKSDTRVTRAWRR